MAEHNYNLALSNPVLPVDIVLSPVWWYKHVGITFDEDFFFHPHKRVEVERKMEKVLYDRWGGFGLGNDRGKDIPYVGAVHLAAGFLLSEMLGCEVEYNPDTPPQVLPAQMDDLRLDIEQIFTGSAFQRLLRLTENLKSKFGYLAGDVNWSGLLNLALDLRGQAFFMDMVDKPEPAKQFLKKIAQVIEKFFTFIEKLTGTTSISVNRVVRFFEKPVCLHSECSNTMISTDDYEKFIFPIDYAWSKKYRPFGIHHCGTDPHRFAESFALLPHLDFLDVGWGGNVKKIRQALPNTFLNLRLSPVEIIDQSVDEIRRTIIQLVEDSGNPRLTGVCCINIDDRITDDKITTIFETVFELRRKHSSG
ncbi:MAG: hypothetical protein JXD22_14675 [Sedimentisphaerales bacterium]|nr:hypothetical protein [Sedimentisphaerales bacterium]